eukprot:150621-Rhodomonas_salina.3
MSVPRIFTVPSQSQSATRRLVVARQYQRGMVLRARGLGAYPSIPIAQYASAHSRCTSRISHPPASSILTVSTGHPVAGA